MDDKPVISVVMAVCNGARTLERSVQSILKQTAGHFEFVIIDDGSIDETPELLEKFSRLDRRIRVATQANAGLTRALISGCRIAQGKWIARQDADDWSAPFRFEKCLALAERHPECTMISSWAEYRGPEGELLDVIHRPPDVDAATKWLMQDGLGPPAHGSMMFRKEACENAGGYRAEFYFGQDSDLWLRMGQSGKIGYVQEVLYQYTLLPGAISGRFAGVQRQFGDIGHLCHEARLRGEPEKPFLDRASGLASAVHLKKIRAAPRSEAGANYRIGVQLARRGDPAASQYFREALRLQPLHWRAIGRMALCALKK